LECSINFDTRGVCSTAVKVRGFCQNEVFVLVGVKARGFFQHSDEALLGCGLSLQVLAGVLGCVFFFFFGVPSVYPSVFRGA
jgi:hypothetical protein